MFALPRAHLPVTAFWILCLTLSFLCSREILCSLSHFLPLESCWTRPLSLEMTFLTGVFFATLLLLGSFLIAA